MSRTKVIRSVRKTQDKVYSNEIIGKFINIIMKRGQKSSAEKIVYQSICDYANYLHTTEEEAVSKITDMFLANKPSLQIKRKRIGASNIQVSVDISYTRGTSIFLRWVRDEFRKRKEKSATAKLTAEIIDMQNGRGGSILKRDNHNKMIDASRVYDHYRPRKKVIS